MEALNRRRLSVMAFKDSSEFQSFLDGNLLDLCHRPSVKIKFYPQVPTKFLFKSLDSGSPQNDLLGESDYQTSTISIDRDIF